MKPRIAFMGIPGYGGLVLDALLENDADIVAVFHQSRRRLHHLNKVYRRYFRSWKRVREGFHRLTERFDSFFDEKVPVPPFGKDAVEIAKVRGLRSFDGSFVHHHNCPEVLRSLDVDVIFVATFGEILPRHILAIPKLAAINMHPSLLPKYRGGFPEFSVIYHGESRSGITFHIMEEKFDTGRILLQRELEINEGETTVSLKARLAKLASDAVPNLLRLIDSRNLTGKPQDSARTSYCRLENNFDLIDSSRSLQQIRNLINACHDVEDIGRAHFFVNREKIFALSYGSDGFPFQASDGMIYFDAVRYRHKIHQGEPARRLHMNLDAQVKG